jgi:hypothetical protein
MEAKGLRDGWRYFCVEVGDEVKSDFKFPVIPRKIAENSTHRVISIRMWKAVFSLILPQKVVNLRRRRNRRKIWLWKNADWLLFYPKRSQICR